MADSEQIYRAVCEVQETVGDIRGQLGRIEERCLNRGETIHSIKRTLFGDNGRGGNTGLISQNKAAIEALRVSRGFWRGFWRDVARTVVAAGILGIAAWLLVLYRATG